MNAVQIEGYVTKLRGVKLAGLEKELAKLAGVAETTPDLECCIVCV